MVSAYANSGPNSSGQRWVRIATKRRKASSHVLRDLILRSDGFGRIAMVKLPDLVASTWKAWPLVGDGGAGQSSSASSKCRSMNSPLAILEASRGRTCIRLGMAASFCRWWCDTARCFHFGGRVWGAALLVGGCMARTQWVPGSGCGGCLGSQGRLSRASDSADEDDDVESSLALFGGVA